MPSDPPRQNGVREALAGRRVLITGATGFLGEALLERLLSDLPDTRAVLLVRPAAGVTAQHRVEQLLTKPAFGPLRDREGDEGMRRLLAERIEVLDGDLVLQDVIQVGGSSRTCSERPGTPPPGSPPLPAASGRAAPSPATRRAGGSPSR